MATKPVEQNVSYNDTLNAKWTVRMQVTMVRLYYICRP